MAAFTRWVAAAEPPLPWAPGTFMRAYAANQRDAIATALESDPVAAALIEFMMGKPVWSGSCSELLDLLSVLVSEPRSTARRPDPCRRTISTGRLSRLEPALQDAGLGVQVCMGRGKRGGRERVGATGFSPASLASQLSEARRSSSERSETASAR